VPLGPQTSPGAKSRRLGDTPRVVIRRKKAGDADEASWDTVVRDYATLMGWWCWHLPDSRRTPPGLPDWLLVRPPRVVWIEGKVPGGRLRRAQKEVLAMLAGCPGVEVYVWIFPDSWVEAREVLR
jgi:hypothetical protein